MSLIVFIIVAIVVAVLVIAGLEKIAAAFGLNRTLVLIVEALVLFLAALVIAQKAGLA